MTRDWRDSANCQGLPTDMFYPEQGAGMAARFRAAKAVCEDCPVRQACLDDALAEEGTASRQHRWGIRGGLTNAERELLAVPTRAPEPAQCGTWTAYRRHLKNGEITDAACREAAREESRRRRAEGRHTKHGPWRTTKPVPPEKHGTEAGYRWHRARDEDACDACLEGARRRDRERRHSKRQEAAS